MDQIPTEARVAQPKARQRAARVKAARLKRLERTPSPALIESPATTPEPSPRERSREMIAALRRVAEEQTRALEGRHGAPVPSSELKALVDVLERLEPLEKSAAASEPEVGPDGIRPFTFIETDQLIEEIAQRFEEFARTERIEDEVLGPLCRKCGAAVPPEGGEMAGIGR